MKVMCERCNAVIQGRAACTCGDLAIDGDRISATDTATWVYVKDPPHGRKVIPIKEETDAV